MNFYPHHIGDYVSATAHLTWTEDAAYRRLMDAYYTREAPLPADVAACCRLVRAASKDERAAVETVLREFFQLGDDGWRHRRCDAEIAKATSKRTKASESAQKRWQGRGDASAGAPAMPTHMRTHMPPHSEGNAPNPNPNPNPPQPPEGGERDPDPAPLGEPPEPAADPPRVSPAARLAIAAREAGVLCQPADPRLIAMAEQGVTEATLRAAIAEAQRARGGAVPLGYVAAVLGTWAQEAAKLTVNGAAQPIRGGGVVAHPSSATPDEATMRRISEANGGQAVIRLPDGRLQCGVHYFRPDGRQEVAI